MPILALSVLSALGIGGWLGSSSNAAIEHPSNIPASGNGAGLDLAKLAGYAIAGGLVFYFGKKIIK
jgi:hypothetical protein